MVMAICKLNCRKNITFLKDNFKGKIYTSMEMFYFIFILSLFFVYIFGFTQRWQNYRFPKIIIIFI